MGTKQVLVVDDEHLNARYLEALLSLDGHQVHLAHGGAHALAIAKEQSIDLVLLELDLPDMHGSELAAALKANPRTRDVPVIAISESDLVADTLRAREAGVVGIIAKPIDYFALRALVGGFLKATDGDAN